MASLGIISASDFTGEFAIVVNGHDQKLESYIEEKEKGFLYDLLGVELADLLIADLVGGVPQTQIYIDIFNEFAQDKPNSSGITIYFPWGYDYFANYLNFCKRDNYYHSKGIKYYLKVLIWFNYVRDYIGVAGVNSNGQRRSTNSIDVRYSSPFTANKFNDAIDTARSIQWYIKENDTDYPEFNGSYMEYTFAL